MKAAQLTSYNKQNIHLTMADIPTPEPQAHQVLVRVRAAGVNPVDNMISRGEVRLLFPYALPLTAGNEMVGVIEKLGAEVTDFQVGERVFARLPLDSIGAFAEYVAVDADALARVPSLWSDTQAAAVPLTALTVMQAFELMGVENSTSAPNAPSGRTIFISGGTGGVGAMAIPLAKAHGLTVITNGSAQHEERVRALGADQFIDYKTQDYTDVLSDVDFVLDTLGGEETEKQMSIMKRGGHLVTLRGVPNGAFASRMSFPWWKRILLSMAGMSADRKAAKYGVTYHFIFVSADGSQLQTAADILSATGVMPSLDEVFTFTDDTHGVNAALDKVAHGHSRGKTVLEFA